MGPSKWPVCVLLLAASAGAKKRRRRRFVAAPTNASNPLLEDVAAVAAYFRETFGHLPIELDMEDARETLILPRNALLREAGVLERLEALSFDATTPLTMALALRRSLGDGEYAARRGAVTVDLVGDFAPPSGVRRGDYFRLLCAPLLHGLLPRVESFRLRVVGARVGAFKALEAEGGWFRATFHATPYEAYMARPAYAPPTLFYAESPGIHDAVWAAGGGCDDHFGRRVATVNALTGDGGAPRACAWRGAFDGLRAAAVPVVATFPHAGARVLSGRLLAAGGWAVAFDEPNAFAPRHGGDDLLNDGEHLPIREVDLLDADDDPADSYARAVWEHFRDGREDPEMPARVKIARNRYVAGFAPANTGEL